MPHYQVCIDGKDWKCLHEPVYFPDPVNAGDYIKLHIAEAVRLDSKTTIKVIGKVFDTDKKRIFLYCREVDNEYIEIKTQIRKLKNK